MHFQKSYKLFILALLCLCFNASSQDTLGINLGSVKPNIETDSLKANINPQGIEVSKDGLDSKVEYGAQDSSRIDVVANKIYLYGEAFVKFEDLQLEADMIIVDMKNSEAVAQSRKDSLNREIKQPRFVQKDQDIIAKKLTFNFKTKKGIVHETVTKQNDLFVHGTKTKIIQDGYEDRHGHFGDVVYNENAIFTTCDDECPHFGIRSKKQKLIPNKMVIVGPSNVEIAGIPTPLFLPFAFLPLKDREQTGLIFPRDFTSNQELGFGLQNVGWYFPINKKVDLTLLADIYLRGSFVVRSNMNYKKKYKYDGRFNLEFSNIKQERPESVIVDRIKSYQLDWSHNQATTAHPYNRFTSSVRIRTKGFGEQTLTDAYNQTNEQLNSSVTYTRKLGDSGFSLKVQARHNQRISQNKVSVTLPQINLNGGSLYPFKKKNRVGEEKWYESIPITYNAELLSKVESTDSTFFTQETLDDVQFGMKQYFNIDKNIKVLKYLDVKPGFNLTETWYLNSIDKEYGFSTKENTTTGLMDTTYGAQTIDVNKFKAVHIINPSLKISTKLYGTKLFKKGFLRGVQHVMIPSVTMSMSPDYTSDFWGYFDLVNNSTDPNAINEVLYSHHEGSLYNNSIPQTGRGSLSYNLGNTVEFKYFSKKDSTIKKFKIFENFNFNGRYDPNADSLKFSRTTFSSNALFFKRKLRVNFTGGLDYYKINEDDRRINTFVSADSKKLFRFSDALLTFSTGFSIKEFWDKKGGSKTGVNKDKVEETNNNLLKDWVGDLKVTYNLSFKYTDLYVKDTLYVTNNSIRIQGDIPLTKNWNLKITQVGYDFSKKRITFPDFTLSRDLHCWEMGTSWRPANGTFVFYLRVKRSSLDFLNLPFDKSIQDVPDF